MLTHQQDRPAEPQEATCLLSARPNQRNRTWLPTQRPRSKPPPSGSASSTSGSLTSAKQAGTVSLDAYEKALQSLVDFEQKAAGATQLDWVSAVANAHARFISEVSGAYVNASRELLK